jgi:integrase/recombinase XerD
MRLLLAGNDVTVIALWLGHEQISTTNVYLHADMTHKQEAIDRTKPLDAKPGRYRPPRSAPQVPRGPLNMPTTPEPKPS